MNRILTLIDSFLRRYAMSLNASDQTTTDVIPSAGTMQAFKIDTIPEEDVNAILQAGLSATSAIGQQPWCFAVITNQDVMKEISSMSGMPTDGSPAGALSIGNSEGTPAGMSKMPAVFDAKASLGDSPVAIIIYMNEGTSSPDEHFDCGLATQNMVIAANALGYGTKIVSAPTMALNGDQHDEICEKLGVDKAYHAVAVLLLGYTDTKVDGSSGASTRSTMDKKVSFIR